ncbi:MAG: hypothetical protein P9L92_14590 [Candidatus Electryonea clarkiae]|nr:hypothetical protein [Candidatus Electryonea clarkiae]MDP8287508.1 hypothetical protein [Candidatus Electryonea clarkiae]
MILNIYSHNNLITGRTSKDKVSFPIFLLLGGLLYFFLCGFPVFASEPILEINPEEATVGDLITVSLTIPKTPPDQIKWPTVLNKLGDFIVLSADTLSQSAAEEAGGAQLSWTVAAYDTGSFSTGSLEVFISDKSTVIPAKEVQIISVIQDSTNSDLRPLKAQAELPFTFADFVKTALPWIIAAAIAAALFFLIRWLILKRKRSSEDWKFDKPKLPPYDEALAALRGLKKDNPLKRGDIKGYVSALSEILKRLLERVHEAPVLEMTTWEVRGWIHDKTIKGSVKEFLELLSASDMVKFAKVALEDQRLVDMYRVAERFVASYKPEPVQTNSKIPNKKEIHEKNDVNLKSEKSPQSRTKTGTTRKKINQIQTGTAKPSTQESMNRPESKTGGKLT